VSWALISAVAAENRAVALREWRVVFLYAGLFLVGLRYVWLSAEGREKQVQLLLIGAWLAGGTLMALIGLWQFASGSMLIQAEGVQRIRGLYGSPNNLALYLERTVALSLALALFGQERSWRVVWSACGLIQLVALLLTFSKGAILLGFPAALITLWIGGLLVVRRRNQSGRLLWAVAGIGLFFVVGLLPFVGTERFQRLLDLSSGTGFIRLQLWRSAWQMALDHPLFGVGPDNFLYAFRSSYILPAAWVEPNLNHPHNIILDWWTRLGVPGLVLGMSFLGAGVWSIGRNFWQKRDSALRLGLLAAALAALAHGLIEVSYALPDLMIAWVLLFSLQEVQAGARDCGELYSYGYSDGPESTR
jgi:O-antigen ligase